MEDQSNVKRNGKRKYTRFVYSQKDVEAAILAINNKELSLCQASLKFNIPKGTLFNKFHKRVPLSRKMGPQAYLSVEEELRIKDWIIAMVAMGFPVYHDDICNCVQNILTECPRDTPFINCRPGRKWLNLFFGRHPEIDKIIAAVKSEAKAKITEAKIRNWFSNLEHFLFDKGCIDLLNDSRRILNCNETGMNTCPKTGKVLGVKGMQNFDGNSIDQEKECTTVLYSISADGTLFPPLVVFPYKRVPATILNNLPQNWFFGRSDSGQIISTIFFEYIANSLYPCLVAQNIPFPVVLLINGHSCHLSLQLSEFCAQKQIYLYCLPQNATHILQPCDVTIFKLLNSHWKNVVQQFKQLKDTQRMSKSSQFIKVNLAQTFKETFVKITPEVIQDGFRTCGLFPYDSNAVEYKKYFSSRKFAPSDVSSSHSNISKNINVSKPTNEEKNINVSKPTNEEFKIARKVIEYVLGDQLLTCNDKYIKTIMTECDMIQNE